MNLLTLLILMASPALALPEAARWGHFSCISCHVNPAGAGVLTSYGRIFAAEKLSSGAYEREEDPLHGLVPVSDRWLLGGDVRSVFMKRKEPAFEEFWTMQADLEGGARFGSYWSTVAVGMKPRGPASEEPHEFALRSFSLRADLWKQRVLARGGLFMPRFGLNLSDHTAYVRIASGLNPEDEQTQIELSFQSDHVEAVGAAMFPLEFSDREDKAKFGGLMSLSSYWARQRLNLGVMYTKLKLDDSIQYFTAFNISGVLTLTQDLYGMFETAYVQNFLSTTSSDTKTTGLATFSTFNAEVLKGFVGFVRYEYWDRDLSTKNSSRGRWGTGFQWYPRPHWQTEWRVSRAVVNASKSIQDQVDIILHYYF